MEPYVDYKLIPLYIILAILAYEAYAYVKGVSRGK